MSHCQIDNATGHFRVVFMHGSGGGPDTEFMTFFAQHCAHLEAEVVRPDFPYWQAVRETGKPRPPNRMPALVDAMTELLEALQNDGKPLILMGKSLGSRVMLRLAEQFSAQRLIALGFPFAPPQKPDKSRLGELSMTQRPGLIIQGTRDPFSKALVKESLNELALPTNWQLKSLEGADHGFEATRAKQHLTPQLWQEAANHITEFLR